MSEKSDDCLHNTQDDGDRQRKLTTTTRARKENQRGTGQKKNSDIHNAVRGSLVMVKAVQMYDKV